MGYFGRLEDKLLAQKLRRHGLSYGEILQKIDVSKGTLSEWCKDIPLTEKQKLRLLNNKKLGQRKGSLVAADNKRQERMRKIAQIRIDAKGELGKIDDRDNFIAGIALYAGEGNKGDGSVGFANTDPLLIKFMMQWFVKFTKVPLRKMRGAIWIHEGLSEKDAKIFWSNLTGIPPNQFHKTYIVKVNNDSRKVRKNLHNHGVFTIRFSDSSIHRKIMGWILALFDGKMVHTFRHSQTWLERSTFRDSSMVEQVAVINSQPLMETPE